MSAALLGTAWLAFLFIRAEIPVAVAATAIVGTVLTIAPTVGAGIAQAYHRIRLDTSRLRLALWLPAIVRLALVASLAALGVLTLPILMLVTFCVSLMTLLLLTVGTGRAFRSRILESKDFGNIDP